MPASNVASRSSNEAAENKAAESRAARSTRPALAAGVGISLATLRLAIADGPLQARNVPRRDGMPRWQIRPEALDTFASMVGAPPSNNEISLAEGQRRSGISRRALRHE